MCYVWQGVVLAISRRKRGKNVSRYVCHEPYTSHKYSTFDSHGITFTSISVKYSLITSYICFAKYLLNIKWWSQISYIKQTYLFFHIYVWHINICFFKWWLCILCLAQICFSFISYANYFCNCTHMYIYAQC